MAVALDVAGTEGFSTGTSPRTYTGLTTGTPTNGAITVTVCTDVHVTGSAATWDGVSMTLLAAVNTTGANGRVELWGLAPISGHTGAKTFSYSWTSGGSINIAILGVSWSGVDQTGGTTSFPHAVTSQASPTTSGATTVNVTSATGNAVIAVHTTDSQTFLLTTNQTQLYVDNSNFPADCTGAANRAAGAATVTMSGNYGAPTGTATVATAGVDILASGGGVTLPWVPLDDGSTSLPWWPIDVVGF